MSKPRIRLLIVEDDMLDRMACRRALAQDPDYEFIPSEAETGREGLQLAHEQKPDCVLLDYHLPDMNGLEFLSELQNELGEIPVPVMMLTGADNASVAVEAMKRGAQDYLVKDLNRQYLELLPAVIQRVLSERRTLVEKQLAEESLTRAEAKYRFLVEQIPAITYTTALDRPGKLLYLSPQIRQLGYSPEDCLADPEGLFKRIYQEDQMRVRTEIARCCEGGEPLRCEYRVLTHSGEIRWLLNEASLVRQESGNPLFLQGILVDITADKALEKELNQHRRRLEELVTSRTAQFEKKSEILKSVNANLTDKLSNCIQTSGKLKKQIQQFEDLYHNAPCAYFSLDTDGVFVQINKTGLKLLGYAREEILGTKFTDLLTPESVCLFMEGDQHLKECGYLSDLPLELANNDGLRLAVLLNANAIKDATGRFVMSRSVIFNVTDCKHASQAA